MQYDINYCHLSLQSNSVWDYSMSKNNKRNFNMIKVSVLKRFESVVYLILADFDFREKPYRIDLHKDES